MAPSCQSDIQDALDKLLSEENLKKLQSTLVHVLPARCRARL